MDLKLKNFEKTRAFYKKELKKDLAGQERDSYSKALKLLEKIIEEEKEAKKKQSKLRNRNKKKNPFLSKDKGLDLIERFPKYKDKKKK